MRKQFPFFKLFVSLFLLVGIAIAAYFLSHGGQGLFTTRSRASYAQQITLGSDLHLTLDTTLPDGLKDVKFFVMKKNGPTKRSEKFGVSGAHGEWDFLLAGISNTYWKGPPFNKDPVIAKKEREDLGYKMLEKHYAMLSALGVSWIRMDFLWQRPEQPVERPDGNYDFTSFDKIFEVAKKYNLNVLSSLEGIPSWMQDQCPYVQEYKKLHNNQRPGAAHWFSPSDLTKDGSERYNRFIRAVVKRYKPHGTKDPESDYGFRYWQIWNEPDVGYWKDCQTGKDGFDPETYKKYADLLKSAYKTIKTVVTQSNK